MTGIAVSVGVLIGVALGWWGVVAVAAIILIVAILVRSHSFVVVLAVVLATTVAGAWRSGNSDLHGNDTSVIRSSETAVVVSAPSHTGRNQHFVIELTHPNESVDPGSPSRICVTGEAVPEVQLGDSIEFRGVVKQASDATVSQQAFLANKRCAGSMYASSHLVIRSANGGGRTLAELRARLSRVLRLAAPGDAGVLLSGLVTGDDEGFSPERKGAFVRTGTTHLTAVSGSNLALIAGIFATIGAGIFGRHRLAWQFITITGIWTYALVSGSQPPAVRSAIVAVVALLAFRFGRRPDFPTLILIAAAAMVLLDPVQIESLGFRLSVAASLALAIALPAIIARDKWSAPTSALMATAAAQVSTLPLLLPVFGTVSLLSVPANILVAPLVAIAMPIAIVAGIAGLVWMPLGEVIAVPAALAAAATLRVVDFLGAPGAYLRLGAPPLPAALTIAATCSVLVIVMSGELAGWVQRGRRAGVNGSWRGLREGKSQRSSALNSAKVVAGRFNTLAPPAAASVGREHPAHSLGAHFDDAEKEPTGEEVGHEVPDEWELTQAVSGKIVGHAQDSNA